MFWIYLKYMEIIDLGSNIYRINDNYRKKPVMAADSSAGCPPFFPQPHPQLALRLEQHFSDMRGRIERDPAVAENVDALVLGGGYGRGEGGVLVHADGGEELFNDLDYFLFARDPDDAALRALVSGIERDGSAALGIDVDVKCVRFGSLPPPGDSMMIYDLAAGHVVVHGDADYLTSRWPRPDASGIPSIEASRLLWNRGTGLYFAACRIAERGERRFVERNHAKFKLAAGDALLCVSGRYHWSSRERWERFQALGEDRFGVAEIYRQGVDFKASPRDGSASWEELAEENRSLVELWQKLFLHVESQRLGVEFPDAAAYVLGRERRSPELPRWKAPLYAMRDFLRYRRWVGPVCDYPRAGLFRTLFCLLSGDLPSPGKFLRRAEPAGGGRARSSWESAYKFWWERYG